MKEIVTCSKCRGTGKFEYKSGMTGFCYQCDGKGRLYKYTSQSYKITIINKAGNRIDWLHQTAKSSAEAIRKARKIAERGIYKDNIDTIEAVPDGEHYTYRKLE